MRPTDRLTTARWTWMGLGIVFLGTGLVIGAAAVLALVRSREPITVVAIAVATLPTLLGVLILTVYAFRVGEDAEGLQLRFAFRDEHVLWPRVIWYSKIAVNLSLKVVNHEAEGSVLVLLKYRSSQTERVAYAFLAAPGLGPAFTGVHNYRTILDERVPTRNRSRLAHPDNET